MSRLVLVKIRRMGYLPFLLTVVGHPGFPRLGKGHSNLLLGQIFQKSMKTRSIPVGCTLPAFFSSPGGGGFCPNPLEADPLSLEADLSEADPRMLVMWPIMHFWEATPPVDSQTPMKTLPCPTLGLRAVIKEIWVRSRGTSSASELNPPLDWLIWRMARWGINEIYWMRCYLAIRSKPDKLDWKRLKHKNGVVLRKTSRF